MTCRQLITHFAGSLDADAKCHFLQKRMGSTGNLSKYPWQEAPVLHASCMLKPRLPLDWHCWGFSRFCHIKTYTTAPLTHTHTHSTSIPSPWLPSYGFNPDAALKRSWITHFSPCFYSMAFSFLQSGFPIQYLISYASILFLLCCFLNL